MSHSGPMPRCPLRSCAAPLPGLLVALAIACEASSAAAQASDGAVPEAVRDLLRSGVEARVRGDEPAALASFRAAHELAPELGRTSAQLGLAHQALAQWLEAEPLLERSLASEDPWVARHREAIESSLAVVRSHLATLDVRAPDGATVVLDDEPIGAPAPRTLRVLEGPHRLRAHLEGHTDAVQVLEVVAGRDVVVVLAPAPLTIAPPEPSPPPDEVPRPGPILADPSPPASETGPSALLWVALATGLAGAGAGLTTHLLAEDAQRTRAAALAARCMAGSAECEALRTQLSAELLPFEIGVNLAWGIAALGGVLAIPGLVLGTGSSAGPSARITPRGLEGRF